MATILSTLLQLVMSLLLVVQGNSATLSDTQKQQILTFATNTVQVVTQASSQTNVSSAPAPSSPVACPALVISACLNGGTVTVTTDKNGCKVYSCQPSSTSSSVPGLSPGASPGSTGSSITPTGSVTDVGVTNPPASPVKTTNSPTSPTTPSNPVACSTLVISACLNGGTVTVTTDQNGCKIYSCK